MLSVLCTSVFFSRPVYAVELETTRSIRPNEVSEMTVKNDEVRCIHTDSAVVEYGAEHLGQDFDVYEDKNTKNEQQYTPMRTERTSFATQTKFSSIAEAEQHKKAQFRKLAIAIAVPPLAFMGVREHVKMWREDIYVKKGLAIIEAQRAKHLNDTLAEDVAEDLNSQKSRNETSSDDENEGNSKDQRKKHPRRPKPGGGSGH